MKKKCTSFAAICAALLTAGTAHAQPGLRDVHPAGKADGRILTMEEVILSRDIVPSLPREYSTAYSKALEEGISFSRKETKVRAVNEGRSLYYVDAEGLKHEVAVSSDPDITYGQSVSRNEFGIDRGVFWSDDMGKLAFYRKDESLVSDFPLLDITTRTGSLVSIKYPMNGMDSERVDLGIYDLESGKTVYVRAEDFGEDRYLTNVSWAPDSRHILIQVLDRSQKHMRLNMYRSDDGSFVKTLLTEDDSRYVEPLDRIWFINGSQFIYRTNNRDAYRNLYLCDTLGNVRRINSCDADVEFLAFHDGTLYYSSYEISPSEKHTFKVSISPAKGKKEISALYTKIGEPVRMTPDRGWHNTVISNDGKWMRDSWSSVNNPAEVRLVSTDLKTEKFHFKAEDPLRDYATGEVCFGSVKSADGKYDNFYRLIKPRDFDPSRKYPVIVYVYGGPHSQMVHDSWLGQIRMWEMYMAQRGYIVYVQDNRGTSYQGREYEQAIHRQCGKAEMEDQMEGIAMLKGLPYVDSDRIGVHGWSYGGFMTISLMTNYPDVFKVGVAGGPVIDWKWYEIMYGERYMETEATNPDGFASVSLINRAADLKGKLLICQGAIDNTVVWEHSLSFVRECIKKNVQLDYFPYPCAEHNVAGRDRIHLMDKVSMYFEDYL